MDSRNPELTLIPVVVLDDGHWDRLNDCKVEFVTPDQLSELVVEDEENGPLECARIVVEAGTVIA